MCMCSIANQAAVPFPDSTWNVARGWPMWCSPSDGDVILAVVVQQAGGMEEELHRVVEDHQDHCQLLEPGGWGKGWGKGWSMYQG